MKTQKGLTLVELMVTLAVAIILVAVGMPLFSGVVANNRATAQANSLLSAMKLARSEAVSRGMDANVCASNSAQTACDGGSPPDWTNGWLVHADTNNNSTFDATDILRIWPPLAASAAVTGSYPGSLTQVGFDSTGAANGAFSFETADTQATGTNADRSKRCISVTGSGQVRVKRPDFITTWTCP